MKKIALAVALSFAASTAFAGNMTPPTMEPQVIVEDTATTSSSGGLVIPLLLLVLVAAAVASN